LYTACYQRFALQAEVKSTPVYDSIELNRRQTLLWGFDGDGVPEAQRFGHDGRCNQWCFWLRARWRFVMKVGLNVM
jgi:hypothetical protein